MMVQGGVDFRKKRTQNLNYRKIGDQRKKCSIRITCTLIFSHSGSDGNINFNRGKGRARSKPRKERGLSGLKRTS